MSKLIEIISQFLKICFLLFKHDPYMKFGSLLSFTCLGMMSSSPYILFLSITVFGYDPSLTFGPENKTLFDLLMGFGFLFGLYIVDKSFKNNNKVCRNLLLKLTGMPGMETENIEKCLTSNFKIGLVKEQIDFVDCFQVSKPINLNLMLKKVGYISELLASKTNNQKNDIHVLMGGLAPIPILVSAGYQMTDRQSLTLIDRSQSSSNWSLVIGIDDFEETNVSYKMDANSEDVAIIMPLSIEINEMQIPSELARNHITLSLKNGPRRDSLSTDNKQKRIAQEFNEICSNIRGQYPNIKRLHIFLASQASFAVRLGTKISTSVMPEVRVYNFDATTSSYPWYVKFTRENEPKIVHVSTTQEAN